MTAAIAAKPKAEMPVIKFPVADVAIGKLSEDYMPLVIRDLDDKEGYAAVREARLDVKSRRVSIEKTRKALKADALEYGRKVDGEAKRLTALLSPIEDHLQSEEDRYNAEKERMKREAEERRRAKLQERMDALRDVLVYSMSPEAVEKFSDAEFAHLLEGHRKHFEAQKAREAAEAEARRKEDERLAAERAKLEEERKWQEAEAAKLRAEQERIAAEKRKLEEAERERQRQAELEQARKEAAERAKREAEEEQRRKEAEAKAKTEREEAERKRIEALRPDSEKLERVALAVRNVSIPTLTDRKESIEASEKVALVLREAADEIEKIAFQLVGK